MTSTSASTTVNDPDANRQCQCSNGHRLVLDLPPSRPYLARA